MTTEDNENAVIPEVLKQNIETLGELNQRLVSVLQNKKQINPSLNGPGQDLMVKASQAYWSNLMENPTSSTTSVIEGRLRLEMASQRMDH